MSLIVSLTRSEPTMIFTYPANYPGWAIHGCLGCLGLKGDCTAAIKTRQVLVSFSFDDGRVGSVAVSTAASDADINIAIGNWSLANPPKIDRLVQAALVPLTAPTAGERDAYAAATLTDQKIDVIAQYLGLKSISTGLL